MSMLNLYKIASTDNVLFLTRKSTIATSKSGKMKADIVEDRILTELKLLEEENQHPAELAFSGLCVIMDYTMRQAPSMLHGAHLISACFNRTLTGKVEELLDKEK
jgi:hypothetical protein|tara:strand:- start:10018 stop:10332 length:315 start_codon:yes stop_codon:yes gene_type:complete